MDEKKKNLLIVGTGPQAQIARDYFSEFTNYKVVGFACHREFKNIDEIYGLPLVTIENLPQGYPPDDIEVFVAIGYKKMNKIRQSVFMEIKNLGFPSIVPIYTDHNSVGTSRSNFSKKSQDLLRPPMAFVFSTCKL